jgi:lysophospholipid acyltransferase (LPLAT)-like uncharacterized protein
VTVADANRPAPTRPRKSGVIVPRQLKWYHHALAWLIAFAARAFSCTWRCRFVDTARVFDQNPGPMIFAVWHNRLAISTVTWERWSSKRAPAAGLVALISASHDGGILSRALGYFGVKAVRGSSSRRGAQALLELTTYTDSGFHVAITPDGPRGPRYVVADGVIALAQVSGRPVIPVSTHYRGKITFKSWDKFQVPLPFARCEIRFGELLHVPREITAEQRQEFKGELQRRLMALTTD